MLMTRTRRFVSGCSRVARRSARLDDCVMTRRRSNRLPNGLFRDANAPIDAPSVSLISAPDTVREVWEAARACLGWAKDGIPFHEMAVVYRNGDPYRALVDEIFREAGISTYLHDGRPLSAHPLGIRLLSLLDLAADPVFSRQDGDGVSHRDAAARGDGEASTAASARRSGRATRAKPASSRASSSGMRG